MTGLSAPSHLFGMIFASKSKRVGPLEVRQGFLVQYVIIGLIPGSYTLLSVEIDSELQNLGACSIKVTDIPMDHQREE